MAMWNLWHGCHKYSEGCAHCYVYRSDSRYDRDSTDVHQNSCFGLPVKRLRDGAYKLPPGETVYTCFTSDFFLAEADAWRPQAWAMMRTRPDLHFLFITKRIARFYDCIPPDWGGGYENVTIGVTMENQRRADERLPLLNEAPIRHKFIATEPLLTPIDFRGQLGPWLEQIVAGGESGPEARLCAYDWVLDIRRQCLEAGVDFHFKQTGALFRKDGKLYRIPRKLQHSQAAKANINVPPAHRLF